MISSIWTKSPEVGSILHQPLFLSHPLRFAVKSLNLHSFNLDCVMKKLIFAIIPLIVTVALVSCEKAELGGEGDGTEEVGGTADDGDGGDNGGWYGGEDGNDEDLVYLGDTVDVETFRTHAIYGQVWVKGYIVGAATGAHNQRRYEFGPEFNFDTAILIADDPGEDDKNMTVPISLTSCSDDLRAGLNLVAHPENKGKFIWIYGVQETYLGLQGIKHIDALKPSDDFLD